MADYTITISNTCRPFGLRRANYWGIMLWGTRWGTIANFEHAVGKVVENTLTATGMDFIRSVDKTVENALTSISQQIKAITIAVSSGQITVSGDMTEMYLQDPAGYFRIFKSYKINAKLRPSYTFSEVLPPTSSYTQISPSTTTWSRI